MRTRDMPIGLVIMAVLLAPGNVFAQTQPNIVIPTIEFSGNSAAFTIKVTTDPSQQFIIGPVVISRDRFTLNGGTFNPLDLNLNLTRAASVNPIGQSTIDATIGNRAIRSSTLFSLAAAGSMRDQSSLIDNSTTANRGIIVNGDDPILTMP